MVRGLEMSTHKIHLREQTGAKLEVQCKLSLIDATILGSYVLEARHFLWSCVLTFGQPALNGTGPALRCESGQKQRVMNLTISFVRVQHRNNKNHFVNGKTYPYDASRQYWPVCLLWRWILIRMYRLIANKRTTFS